MSNKNKFRNPDGNYFGQKRKTTLKHLITIAAFVSFLNHFTVQAQQEYPPKVDSISDSVKQVDSIRQTSQSHIDTLQSLADNVHAKLDSLGPGDKLQKAHNKLDSVRGRLAVRIDSIKSLNPKDMRVAQSLDSIQSKLDSVKTLAPLKNLKRTETKLSSLQSGVTSKVDQVEKKIAAPMNKFAENGANVPGDINLPTGNLETPEGGIPGLDLPGGQGLDMPSVALDTPEGGLDGSIESLPKQDFDLRGLDELNQMNETTGKIGEVSGEIGSYGDKLGNPENLSSDLESGATSLDEMDGLEDNLGQVAEIKKWQSDPDYMKEMAQTKLKKQSVNHFAGHEKELQAAVEQLSKLKTKYPRPEGALDLFAKRQNFVKDKTFTERLVPGINLQVAANNNWWFDFNPYIGYQLHTRWTAGLGWNERVAVNFKEWRTIPFERIHGPRSYLEFSLKEKLILKTEVEVMNTEVISNSLFNPESLGRQWVCSYFVGVKNVFKFSEKLKGHVQMMYNLYNPDKRSPYNSRLSIRFGLEFPMRKKTKTAIE